MTFARAYTCAVFMYAGGGIADDSFTLSFKCARVHAEFHPKTRSNVRLPSEGNENGTVEFATSDGTSQRSQVASTAADLHEGVQVSGRKHVILTDSSYYYYY